MNADKFLNTAIISDDLKNKDYIKNKLSLLKGKQNSTSSS
jgi:hypothetical protein